MNISMDKKYTLDGEVFTVLTVTRPGGIPVAGHVPSGRIFGFHLDGSNSLSTQRLVEVSPYADFVIDEPVMVRDFDDQPWFKRVFRGIESVKGRALAYQVPAWSDIGPCPDSWRQCRRPTAEELAK